MRDQDLTIQPEGRAWPAMARCAGGDDLLGHPVRDWRLKTRRELSLAVDRPIVATGHQTLLWHPGILVKYLAADAVASAHGLAVANLIVDQHVDVFGSFEVPVRRRDGALAVRRIDLGHPRPGVPMSLHDAITPPRPPRHLDPALDSVSLGIEGILAAVYAHRGAANAALQMAHALADLMRPWVGTMPNVTAGELIEVSLSRAILAEMVRDPRRCATVYNEAVAAFPEAGIGTLLIRDDYVELPLWRLRDDGRRMHAYDNDVEAWLDGGADAKRLMPRALLMTALVRLGMCDLFVHGVGGANYDRAMERWVKGWLGVEVDPAATATATLRLPLGRAGAPADGPPGMPGLAGMVEALAAARRAWHDPEPPDAPAPEVGGAVFRRGGPGPVKGELLEAIGSAPYGSGKRRAAFFAMHRQLESLRSVNIGWVERWQRAALEARAREAESRIAGRRDWPFPLYPAEMIDGLAAAVRASVSIDAAPAT